MFPLKYQLRLLLEGVHIGHQVLGTDGLEALKSKRLPFKAQTLMKETSLNTII